jgi:hypothetical protein
LIVFQPAVFTSTPAANDESACTPKTVISFVPCAFAFSEGRYVSVSSVEPPM